jgi:uncharacterized protein
MMYALVGVLGLAAGVVSGLFGIGGAILVVPGLVLLAKLPQHTANGTSLGALLLPVGILGFFQYYKRGQVSLPLAAIIAIGLFLGAFLGAKLAGSMTDMTLRRLFGVLLLMMAGKFLFF